jgi:hypothetical protein
MKFAHLLTNSLLTALLLGVLVLPAASSGIMSVGSAFPADEVLGVQIYNPAAVKKVVPNTIPAVGPKVEVPAVVVETVKESTQSTNSKSGATETVNTVKINSAKKAPTQGTQN